jgi:hypothetical protein
MIPVLSACSFPLDWLAVSRSDRAELTVDIHYTGEFYTEVFNYSPDAGNIRHVVLVMPENLAARTRGAGWIFTSIEPQVAGGMIIRADREEYLWALDYLYEAPGGVFSGAFKPGTYAVAAAFLAGPVPSPGEDAILWPGITGGGASTDYRTVELVAGETLNLTFEMTDANGWACPWLYVFDGAGYRRVTEILRNQRGVENQAMEITPLVGVSPVDGTISLRVVEEKDETTYLDALYLLVDGVPVYAGDYRLHSADGDSVILHRGDSLDLRFAVGELAGDVPVAVAAAGYYVPEEQGNAD